MRIPGGPSNSGEPSDPGDTSSPRDEPLDAEVVEATSDFTAGDVTPAASSTAGGSRAPSIEDVTGYTEGGVPTFEFVRDKIERRTATADGGQFLAEAGPEAAAADEAMAARDEAARAKLDEIRRSMGR